jgi:hypothetical protein
MKNSRFTVLAASCISVAFALAGCGGATKMVSAKIAPFSEGEVEASAASDGNGSVSLHVKHLGDPAKLDKAATTYVIWLTPDGTSTQTNMGPLKVDSDGEGKKEFPTAYKKFKLMITAETAPDVTAAGGNVVLTADVVAH